MTSSAKEGFLRGYQPGDLLDLYDVCVRTGDQGRDATGKLARPELLGDIFVGPYVEHEPDLAFVVEGVVEGEGRAVGYVLGTADTEAFVQWYSSSWAPRFGPGYAEPEGAARTPEEQLLAVFHHPEHMLRRELAGYPAHLHIDILPPYQGSGWGRRLMGAFLDAAAKAGAPAVHLGVGAANEHAQGFYRRLGFHEIDVPGAQGVLFFGRSTSREQ